jgi:hypothetical protein
VVDDDGNPVGKGPTLGQREGQPRNPEPQLATPLSILRRQATGFRGKLIST